MSSSRECEFVEVSPNEWWYLLEGHFAQKDAWNWREEATAYGPFASEEEGRRHLRENHSNPGGSTVLPYEPGFQPDEILVRLMEEAREEAKANPPEIRRYSRW